MSPTLKKKATFSILIFLINGHKYFLHLADSSFHSVEFNIVHIMNLINNQNYNKAHGHNMISICRLRICGISVFKTSELIFNACLREGFFTTCRKKSKAVSVNKKDDRQNVPNYKPVSLLSKNFKRYNAMFWYFIGNESILPNQSGLKSGFSCIKQLIAIRHKICRCFYDSSNSLLPIAFA